jgi:hypothetical protein
MERRQLGAVRVEGRNVLVRPVGNIKYSSGIGDATWTGENLHSFRPGNRPIRFDVRDQNRITLLPNPSAIEIA